MDERGSGVFVTGAVPAPGGALVKNHGMTLSLALLSKERRFVVRGGMDQQNICGRGHVMAWCGEMD